MAVFVISKSGERLMPTTRYGKVKHMLKDGRAVIYQRHPFTIQLQYETTTYTQPMELCMDTGYQNIGVSIKSPSQEYISEQYILLPDEKERHDDKRKYRRTRRNKLRYRAPRFNNRRRKESWLAPSLKNKADRHVDIAEKYLTVAPIDNIVLEMGQFDPVVLEAIDKGLPLPSGLDYQYGPMYGVNTLREAVFQRDHYTCKICQRSTFKDDAILHAHHMLFWKGIHRDKVGELIAVCERCHTPPNHKSGGKLWGLLPKDYVKGYPEAAFMNTVRWYIYNTVKTRFGSIATVKMTYGAATKESRITLGLEKSHTNDAYAMGNFHPVQRAETKVFQKRRRNNRILSKFYDAKYIDARDGTKKSGAELFNGRINRNHKKDSENLHQYRQRKVSKGRTATRTQRYAIQPGDMVIYQNKRYITGGCQHYGQYITLQDVKKSVNIKNITLLRHKGGWSA